jgi:ATP-dependent Clp protease protease subunit
MMLQQPKLTMKKPILMAGRNSDDDNEDGCFAPPVVGGADNKIFFFESIDNRSVLSAMVRIEDMIVKMTKEKDPRPIYLYLNSPGGVLLDAISFADYIYKSQIPIHTIASGICASAATVVSLMGKRRFITKHSYMLIHQIAGGVSGKYEEMKDDMKNSEELMKKMLSIYKERAKFDAKTLQDLMKHDLFLDAAKCLKYKLVDEIVE